MDEDGLPIVGSGVDLTKVPAIQQRKIVAFLNQFIVNTVRFLNRFSTVCEEKLATVSLRIQQIETTLSILEAKKPTETNGPAAAGSHATGPTLGPPVESLSIRVSQQAQVAPQEPKAEAPAENVMTVAKDPRYARYLKMVQVGVPVMAIKNKMVMEGLDPGLLDTPDAPVPDGAKKGLGDQDDDSSGSESSFSD